MSHVFQPLLSAILLACLATHVAGAQSYPAPPAPQGRGPFGRHLKSQIEDEQRQDKPVQSANQMSAAQLEKQRYLELRQATTELARMAEELKFAVAESNEHTLSLELAKKADQVEKFSKKIRNRIKHGY